MLDYNSLLKAAKEAATSAYAPYSEFPVGAAVLTATGKVIVGANVENASYGLAMCAERVAIFNAVFQGESNIVAIAVVSPRQTLIFPCGACRQVLHEFSSDAEIVAEGEHGKPVVKLASELLPLAFGSGNLEAKAKKRRTSRG